MTDVVDEAASEPPLVLLNCPAARDGLTTFDRFLALFVLGGILSLATYALSYAGFVQVERGVAHYGYGFVPPESMAILRVVEDWANVIDAVPAVIFLAGFFAAMWNARRIAIAMGVRGFKYGYFWTVVTIIVPFLNLYRPWVGLAEIRRAIMVTEATENPTTEGEFSGATLLLGLAAMGGSVILKGIVRALTNMQASDEASFVRMMFEYKTGLAAAGAIELVILSAFFVYLVTIRRSARRLVARGCA